MGGCERIAPAPGGYGEDKEEYKQY